jgi:D-sedoheptulose 7-phosphate isomerase
MNLLNYKRCVNELRAEQLQALKETLLKFSDIIILGNGGSNAIASHTAQDYTKALGKRALSFNDAARLSCYANDYGWEQAYVKYINDFATAGTLIILISASGNSPNILNAAAYCKRVGYPIIILSGFNRLNELETKYADYALLHFWVDSTDYGIVECVHELILHSVI